jgi:hypothetical protein
VAALTAGVAGIVLVSAELSLRAEAWTTHLGFDVEAIIAASGGTLVVLAAVRLRRRAVANEAEGSAQSLSVSTRTEHERPHLRLLPPAAP